MQSRYERRRMSSAFTLIELLVVIAIIAILAAILFPVFAQAREKARQALCLSNTKQLGLAIYQYIQDYDELLPNGTYQYCSIGGWAGQIQPYSKNAGVFRCPSDVLDVGSQWKPSSYGMNSNFGVPGTGGVQNGVLTNQAFGLPDLTAPSKTVLLFEVEGNNEVDVTQYMEGPYTINQHGSPFGNGVVDSYSPSGGGTFPSCPRTGTLRYATGYMGHRDVGNCECHYTGKDGRHNGGSNFLMADSHVKWFQGSHVSSGGNATSESDSEVLSVYGNAAGTSGTMAGISPAATFSIK